MKIQEMIWALSGVLFASGMCEATTFAPRPFVERTHEARVVVRGTIGNSSTQWSTGIDGSRRIYTYTDLEVQEVLRGSVPERTVIARELGGEKDGTGMSVPGTARFARGEEVVLFLNPAQADAAVHQNVYDVEGMMMGKYTVVPGENGTEFLKGPGLILGLAPGAATPIWTMERFKQELKVELPPSHAPSAANAAGPPQTDAAIRTATPTQPLNPSKNVVISESRTDTAASARTGFPGSVWVGIGVLIAAGFYFWRRQ